MRVRVFRVSVPPTVTKKGGNTTGRECASYGSYGAKKLFRIRFAH